jgi:hypothetical protein
MEQELGSSGSGFSTKETEQNSGLGCGLEYSKCILKVESVGYLNGRLYYCMLYRKEESLTGGSKISKIIICCYFRYGLDSPCSPFSLFALPPTAVEIRNIIE